MPGLTLKKRTAAQVLGVGVSRIRLDPERLDEIGDAITRASIRSLVKSGAIWAEPAKGISRGRFRANKARKKGRGPGSKKGARGARVSSKTRWILKVRALRRHLKILKDRGAITNVSFNALYKQVKNGEVRSVRHLRELVKEHIRR